MEPGSPTPSLLFCLGAHDRGHEHRDHERHEQRIVDPLCLPCSPAASTLRYRRFLATFTRALLTMAALMSFQVIDPTFALVAALAGALLAVDSAACLVVARLFDRERLITGARPGRGVSAPAAPRTSGPQAK